MRLHGLPVALGCVLASTIAGCDGGTTAAPVIALSVSTGSVSLGQGQSQQVTVEVQRTNFDKTVTLSVQGLPTGVTAEFAQSPLPSTISSTILTVTAAGNALPGTTTLTVLASGDGVAQQSQSLGVTVSITGSYTIGLLEPSLIVAQGGGGTATVQLVRAGGNASDVSVVVSGLPTGIGASVTGSPTSGPGLSILFAAAASVAPGTYPITITSSSPGISPDQTASLSLEVIAPPATASATVAFCTPRTWFAIRNSGYPWQQITPTGASYTFQATDRVVIAYVVVTGQSSQLIVDHLTRAQLAPLASASICPGARTHSGTVAGLSAGQVGFVAMSRSFDVADVGATAFTLSDLSEGPIDLVATRGAVTQFNQASYLTPDRIIIRRGVDQPSGSALAELNFTAGESFAPASTNVTLNGVVSGEQLVIRNLLMTATTPVGLVHSASPLGNTATLYAVPAAQLAPSDLHELLVDASISSRLTGHVLLQYFGDPADRTVDLGPVLAVPAASMVASAPHARFRGTLPAQTEYPSVGQFVFRQIIGGSDRRVYVAATSEYFGGTPATWALTIPDLSAATGFSASWALAPGSTTDFAGEAYFGAGVLYRGSPVDGTTYRWAFHQPASIPPAGVTAVRAATRQAALPLSGSAPGSPQYLRR